MDHKHLVEKIKEIANQDSSADRIVAEAMTAILDAHKAYYWVGVYLLKGDFLHLGPFAGPPTDHVKIPVGRGVCGTAVAEGKDQNVADVSALENYLSCNIYTKSELVSLVHNDAGKIIGQIDIDATEIDAFDAEDEKCMTEIGRIISHAMGQLEHASE